MKKAHVKYWLSSLCLLLLIAGSCLIYKHQAIAEEKQVDYVFYVNGNKYTNLETLELQTNSELKVWIGESDNKDGIPAVNDSDVDWSLQGDGVIKLTKEDKLTYKLQRGAPGFATITVRFTFNGKTYTRVLNIKVDFKVDENDLKFTTDKEQSLWFGKDDTTKQINLKYVNPADKVNDVSKYLNFTSLDPNVATVSPDGVVTKVGAGKTEILIRTNTTTTASGEIVQTHNQFIEHSVPVVVSPTAYVKDDGTDHKYTLATPSNGQDVLSSVQIVTNAVNASKLIWKFYDITDTTKEPVEIKDTSKYFTYSLPGDSTMTLSNLKAGTYYVMAFVHENNMPSPLNFAEGSNEIQSKSTPYLKVKITVYPNLNYSSITMNIDDTYSLWDASNLIEGTGFSLTFNTDTGTQNIVDVNGGILTGKNYGEVDATLTVMGKSFPLKIRVIDYIKLSMSQATMYTSGKLSLVAFTSNNGVPVKWTTSNDLVTVSGSGQNVVIIAGTKTGQVTVTASQTIDGVVKKSTCVIYVQAGVNKITISPSEVSIFKDQTASLTAEIDPSEMNNVKLIWSSSDTGIVEVLNTDSAKVVNVKGKSAGTAIITAVNTDNIVVGYAKVTVKEKITGINVTPTNITLALSAKTYQLKANVLPSTANQNVKWTSNNTSVATVSNTGLVTLLAPGTVVIVAASEDDPTMVAVCTITVEQAVTGIKLDETTKLMYVGETARMGYILTPTNATSKVTWSSTNTSVASVDANGEVKATGVGMTIIVVKTADGSYMSTCTLTVKQKATGLDFDVTNLELSVGQTYTLKVKATPANAEYSLKWSSLDNTIATVDDNGTVTGKAVGKTVIIATNSTGGAIYCNVIVKAVATGLQLNYSEKTVVIGDTLDIKATIKPSNAASTVSVVWTSSKPKVASISSKGKLKALKGGTTVIKATTSDGKYTSFCIINVVERVTSVKLNKTYYRLGVGKSYTLKATVKTNSATNPKLKWTSSNTKVATVDQNGKVKAKSIGTAVITATAQDGTKIKASATIRVVRAATSVTLNKTSVNAVVGRAFTLKATVKPSNATFKTVYWSSSDESIAIVDTNGRVTPLKAGVVRIKATAKDNSGKYAIATVFVSQRVPANSVTIINQNLTMVKGETTTLQKAINPSTSTDTFIWQSDNKTVATVNSKTGKVTAKAPGIANITVMTESGKMATTKVTVVGLNKTKLTLEQYTNYRLSVVGVDSGVTWDIDDNTIAVVNNGLVSARRVGTTYITATVNGRKLRCKLTVTKIR